MGLIISKSLYFRAEFVIFAMKNLSLIRPILIFDLFYRPSAKTFSIPYSIEKKGLIEKVNDK